MNRFLLCSLFVGLTGLLVSSPAEAATDVNEVKIVVPDAKGKKAWGSTRVTKAVRTILRPAIGELISNKKFKKAQKKLRQSGSARFQNEKLAAAGKEVGADYVMKLVVTKKGWEFTARALLISTATGEVDMDFRSAYYNPKTETKDRGGRIAKKALEKIALLISQGKGPPQKAIARAPKPSPFEKIRDEPVRRQEPKQEDNSLNERMSDSQDERVSSRDTSRDESRLSAADNTPAETSPRETSTANTSSDEPADPQPRLADNVSSQEQRVDIALDEPEQQSSSASTDGSGRLVHLRVAAGSNFTRTYKLSSDAVEESGLSYPLNAMSLFNANLQVNLPGIPLGVFGNVNFVPLKIKVSVDSTEVGSPGGSLLDMLFGVNYQMNVGNSGLKLMPGLGTRITNFDVDNHPGPIVLSNSSLAPVILFGLTYPVVDTVDINAGVEAGYVVSFEETPNQSGAGGSKGGFDLGANLGLGLWLSEMVAITVNFNTVMQQVSLSGSPNRQTPPNESLENPTVSIFDVRGALGIEVRL